METFTFQAAPDIDVVPAYFPILGLGILPVNAFVLKAAEPFVGPDQQALEAMLKGLTGK
jgi:hypothetical protein